MRLDLAALSYEHAVMYFPSHVGFVSVLSGFSSLVLPSAVCRPPYGWQSGYALSTFIRCKDINTQ